MPSVLLLDDNVGHCETLARILTRAGYDVRVATNGREAGRCFVSRAMHAVVANVAMPLDAALEVARILQSFDLAVPILILAWCSERETYLVTMNGELVEHFTKLMRRDDVLFAIERALARRGIQTPASPRDHNCAFDHAVV